MLAFLSINRCMFHSSVSADDQLPGPTDEQLSDILQKDMVMNVFRYGAFGSFRHLPLLGPSGCFFVFTYLFDYVTRLSLLTLMLTWHTSLYCHLYKCIHGTTSSYLAEMCTPVAS